MSLFTLLLVALGLCYRVAAWTMLRPVHVLALQRVQVDLINGGYLWPYQFEVWRNVSGKNDERVHIEGNINTAPIFWDNDQSVGTFIRFVMTDSNGSVANSAFIQIEPNPQASASSVSIVSASSVASVISTATISLTTGSSPATNTQTWTSSTEMASSVPSPGPTSVQTNMGAIVGGVVGGVLVLAAITAALVFFLRRRKPKPGKEEIDILNQPTAVTPFVYEDPYHNRANQPQRYDDPSQPYQGAGDAPPVYSPPPTSHDHSSSDATSSYATSSVARGRSTRKGAYAPVSTVAR